MKTAHIVIIAMIAIAVIGGVIVTYIGLFKPAEEIIELEKKTITITDMLGRNVTVEVPVERIVVTFNVEELVAVGGEDALKKIVGWSQYYWKDRRLTVWETYVRTYPWIADIPDVGYPWKGTFSAEKVIELKPDVVIMAVPQYKDIKEDVEKLDRAGVPVVCIDYYKPFNLISHTKSTLILGKLLNRTDRAQKLVEFYLEQIEKTLVKLRKIEREIPKPKVLLLGKGWTTYGKNHYRGKMIEYACGLNIASNVIEQSGEINPEYVLQANPDVIIFIGKVGWNVDLGYGVNADRAKAMLSELIQRPGWESLNAVKNGRVYAIHIYFVHGHIYDFVALQYYAKWFYPDVFENLNPEGAWKTFHEEFLPVEYSGTWAIKLETS